MSEYAKTKTNSRGDIVTVPTGLYKDEEMTIIIPKGNMAKVSNATTAFHGAKVVLPTASIVGAFSALALGTAPFFIISTLALIASLMFVLMVSSPTKIAAIGADTIKVSPKYLSEWHYTNYKDIAVWTEDHQKEFLDILDNDFVRDDFIQLLQAVESKDIAPSKAKEMYKYMKEVGMTEQKIIEKSMDTMLDKYKSHVEIIREIETA